MREDAVCGLGCAQQSIAFRKAAVDMTADHFDQLETRDPEAREQSLFALLPDLVRKTMASAPGWADHLKGVDPAAVASRDALAKLPILRIAMRHRYAVIGFARARVGKRAITRLDLVIGQCAQDNTRGAARATPVRTPMRSR